jgi:hypothetical protein
MHVFYGLYYLGCLSVGFVSDFWLRGYEMGSVVSHPVVWWLVRFPLLGWSNKTLAVFLCCAVGPGSIRVSLLWRSLCLLGWPLWGGIPVLQGCTGFYGALCVYFCFVCCPASYWGFNNAPPFLVAVFHQSMFGWSASCLATRLRNVGVPYIAVHLVFVFFTYRNFIFWLMRNRVASWSFFKLCLLFPFTLMEMYLGVICLSLHVSLYQMAAVVLYSFFLMLWYWNKNKIVHSWHKIQNFISASDNRPTWVKLIYRTGWTVPSSRQHWDQEV